MANLGTRQESIELKLTELLISKFDDACDGTIGLSLQEGTAGRQWTLCEPASSDGPTQIKTATHEMSVSLDRARKSSQGGFILEWKSVLLNESKNWLFLLASFLRLQLVHKLVSLWIV